MKGAAALTFTRQTADKLPRMTSTPDLINAIKGERVVIGSLFLKRDADEHLALELTEEEWANLSDWFDSSGWQGEVEELFASYLNTAIHNQRR